MRLATRDYGKYIFFAETHFCRCNDYVKLPYAQVVGERAEMSIRGGTRELVGFGGNDSKRRAMGLQEMQHLHVERAWTVANVHQDKHAAQCGGFG